METEKLLRDLSSRCKWNEVKDKGDLPRALELTLHDEIVRAVRNRPGQTRLSKLEELGRESRARCIARWQAAGVSSVLAAQFADDESMGSIDSNLEPSASNPIVVLSGELGVGKSLLADRFFQRALEVARRDPNAPVPVFLELGRFSGSLRDAVLEETEGWGDPPRHGARIVLDRVDEGETGLILSLLNDARVLVRTWPNTTAIIASRGVRPIACAEEIRQVAPLTLAQVDQLFEQLLGRKIWIDSPNWPEAFRDAVRRPLFALLAATYFRTNASSIHSTGDLLSTLVRGALTGARGDLAKGHRLLKRLARLVLERGGAVVTAEVADGEDAELLLRSRLVTERRGALNFPLPILTQWFAAQELAEENVTGHQLAADKSLLWRWRYPLIIFASSFSHDHVSAVFKPIVEEQPAFAAQLIDDAIDQWSNFDEMGLPPPGECGKRVAATMESWIIGLGRLAELVAPIRNGHLLPLGYLRADPGWSVAGTTPIPARRRFSNHRHL